MDLGEMWVYLGLKSSIEKDLKKVKSQAAGIESSFDSIGSSLDATSKSMSKVGGGLTKGVTVPLAAAGASFVALTMEAAGFEKQMNEVYTLIPNASKEMKDSLSDDVLELSKEFGILPEEVVPALYSALSAGVPPDNVVDFLRTSAKASIGGVTDLNTAVDGLTSVVNAYGDDVIGVAEASDIMFTAVRLGKTDFTEMSDSLYNVIPTAAAVGVGFDEIAAAMATLTAQGVPTAQATTYLNSLMGDLMKSGSKAGVMFEEIAGQSFPKFIENGGTLAEALAMIGDHSELTDTQLVDMFGSMEAAKAVMGLTGKGADAFAANLDQMANSVGATDTAFAEFDDDTVQAMNQVKASLAAVAVELGQSFIPIMRDDLLPIIKDDLAPFLTNTLIPGIQALAEKFSSMSPTMKKAVLIFGGLAAALGPVLLVLAPVVGGVASLATAIGAAGGLTAILGGFAGTIVAVGTGLVAFLAPFLPVIAAVVLLYLAFKNWDKITAIAKGAFAKVSNFLSGIDFKAVGLKIIKSLGTGLMNVAVAPYKIMFDIMNKVTESVFGFNLYDAGKSLINTFVDGIKSVIHKPYETVEGALDKLNKLFPHSPAKEGPFRTLPNWNAVFDGVEDVDAQGMAKKQLSSMSSVLPSGSLSGAAAKTPSIAGGNTYGGDNYEIKIGTVNDQQDVDYLMAEIDRRNKAKRQRRGITA